MIKHIIGNIEHKIHSSAEIQIAGKRWKEITNYQYELTNQDIDELFDSAPDYNLIEDVEERFAILEYFSNFDFEKDLYTRQACIQPKYNNDENMAACLSTLQVIIRESGIELHVFVRSQNFTTNFLYDNKTYAMIVKQLSKRLKLNVFKVFIKITSLHIQIY